ncbi:MAG: sugar biosynthesis protein [Deltaproteobacteria bacterium]|nr:sugar biosynthesis protein [Deltaproteobacteria bacterium]
MTVIVLIKRHFKHEFIHDAHFYNVELRALATVQTGYISGTTMVRVDNQHKMLILSTWESKEVWDTWYSSDLRKDYYKKLRVALEAPEEIEIYSIGAKK